LVSYCPAKDGLVGRSAVADNFVTGPFYCELSPGGFFLSKSMAIRLARKLCAVFEHCQGDCRVSGIGLADPGKIGSEVYATVTFTPGGLCRYSHSDFGR